MTDAEIDGAPRATRRRATWSRACPFCLSSSLVEDRSAVLTCAACELTIPRPPREASFATWENDPRLHGDWDRYSRPGRLVDEWGRSTQRENGGPPTDDEEAAQWPTVRAKPVMGRQDALLDEAIREYVNQTAGLRSLLERLPKMLLRFASTVPPAPKASTPELLRILLDHTAEATDVEPAKPWDGSTFRSLSTACASAMKGCLQALGILASNALKKRGVEYGGSLDMVSVRTRRSQPFASYRHAIRAAFGTSERSSTLPYGAIAAPLPQGVVFGLIHCKPTRSYASAKSPDLDGDDVLDLLGEVRIWGRTRYEAGKGRIVEPGRPMNRAERELLRLVDSGEWQYGGAKTKRKGGVTRIVQEAIIPLHPRTALARVKGMEGAPRTEKEARLFLKEARRVLTQALEDRNLIPQQLVRRHTTALPRHEAAPRRAPRQTFDPFAGVGVEACQ